MKRVAASCGLVVCLALASLGCGRSAEQAKRSSEAALDMSLPEAAPAETEARLAGGSGAPVAATPQKLIRTSAVQLEVESLSAATMALTELAKSLGGYVADTQVSRHPEGHSSGQMVLRIPTERFDTAGRSVRALGKVLGERATVEDVTKAYTDVETRLKVKREALARIRELLKTRAGNLKDVLEAEREIARITEEIELAEGERRFYDHQIQLSTLTVDLTEPVPVNLSKPGSWQALGDVLRDASSLVAKSLAALLAVMLVLIPWLLAGYGVFRAGRWLWRRRKTRKTDSPAEAAPSK